MHYTLHQLQVFLKVTQTGSITKASEELHLTQPAVSIQLKNFQDQFKIPLTEIVGRKLYVTDFGKEIAIAAENIINQVYAINYKTLAYEGNLAGRLRISVVSTGKYVMPYFLSEFIQLNPGIELEMDVTNKAKVIESMEANTVDFSLVSKLPENMKIKTISLLENKLFLVGHAIPETNNSKTQLLENLPLIYREQGSWTRTAMEQFLESNEIKVKKKLELTSNEAVKQAMIAGLGYSIMPLIGLKNELLNNQLKIIPLKGLPIVTTWHLIWQASKNVSPVAQAFIDYLTENKTRIIENNFKWYESY